jgi:hypothetical protein
MKSNFQAALYILNGSKERTNITNLLVKAFADVTSRLKPDWEFTS